MEKFTKDDIYAGDHKAIARAITHIVNSADQHKPFLEDLLQSNAPVIGITGPPGAGKSTLTDKIIGELVRDGNYVAVICVDPSSPFTNGAILGDRIRMNEWYDNPAVFIRSLASRGSVGGLPAMADQITRLLKAAPFDYIIFETVGVGQNEVQIASIADCTIVVLVPESGDDVQVMKAGLMEIADIYVVNKCDRPGGDVFAANLKTAVHGTQKTVVKTIANTKHGVGDLMSAINNFLENRS